MMKLIIVLLGCLVSIYPLTLLAEVSASDSDLKQKVQLIQQMMAANSSKKAYKQPPSPSTAAGQQSLATIPNAASQPAPLPAQPTAQTNDQSQLAAPQMPAATASQNSQGLPPTGDTQSGAQPIVANQLKQQLADIVSQSSSTDDAMHEQAFSGVINQLLPMTPDQIVKLKEVFNETQLAASLPPGVPPKPTTTSLIVNLSPQAAPPVIRLGAGYISSLVFVDSTGQPWPIEAYSIGDPTAFNIQWDRKSNTLLVQSASFYKRSNLAVILKELNTPVMLTLLAGQQAVDYRVDLRIPGVGPNAMFIQNGLPDVANPILLDVLNGVAPKGSKQLKVTGGDCQAWLFNNKLFVRTSLEIISPAWRAIMTSIDGTHAYELQPAPILLALQRGKDKALSLTLEGLN
jgi:intracellular multiplication protein IcmK